MMACNDSSKENHENTTPFRVFLNTLSYFGAMKHFIEIVEEINQDCFHKQLLAETNATATKTGNIQESAKTIWKRVLPNYATIFTSVRLFKHTLKRWAKKLHVEINLKLLDKDQNEVKFWRVNKYRPFILSLTLIPTERCIAKIKLYNLSITLLPTDNKYQQAGYYLLKQGIPMDELSSFVRQKQCSSSQEQKKKKSSSNNNENSFEIIANEFAKVTDDEILRIESSDEDNDEIESSLTSSTGTDRIRDLRAFRQHQKHLDEIETYGFFLEGKGYEQFLKLVQPKSALNIRETSNMIEKSYQDIHDIMAPILELANKLRKSAENIPVEIDKNSGKMQLKCKQFCFHHCPQAIKPSDLRARGRPTQNNCSKFKKPAEQTTPSTSQTQTFHHASSTES